MSILLGELIQLSVAINLSMSWAVILQDTDAIYD